jgi:hypothetical protein
MSKKDAARAAGYAAGTKSGAIEGTKAFQTIQAEIEAAEKAAGFTVAGNLARLQRIIRRKGQGSDADAISAIKVGTWITGKRAPDRVQVDVSRDESILANLAD